MIIAFNMANRYRPLFVKGYGNPRRALEGRDDFDYMVATSGYSFPEEPAAEAKKNEALRKARRSAKLNIRGAAKEAGIHYQTWSRCEHGKNYPKKETQERICGVLKKSRILNQKGYFVFREGLFPYELKKSLPKVEAIPLSSLSSAEISVDPEAERLTYIHERREKIYQALSYLTPRQRLVIENRYGLYDGAERTLYETAESLNLIENHAKPLSRERIRQIEGGALKKLIKLSQSENPVPDELKSALDKLKLFWEELTKPDLIL